MTNDATVRLRTSVWISRDERWFGLQLLTLTFDKNKMQAWLEMAVTSPPLCTEPYV